MQPLADALRPQSLEDVVGQEKLVGTRGFISSVIQHGHPLSILLWGPPGCGKTSIARLYAKAFEMPFKNISAIFSGIADLKKIIKEVEETPLFTKGVVLFVDEIHRFNKAQQDAFLPFIEKGTIVLVGATAENPSFYLNDALLSRLRVLKLNPLSEEALNQVLLRCETVKGKLPLTDDARAALCQMSQGDGRYLLNLAENLYAVQREQELTTDELHQFLQKKMALFDKGGDQHYNLISALHKSIRGSAPDAALYWFCRMLEGGEDPLYIARRLIRIATEDIGLADPQALPLTISARDAFQMLGSPEGELALAEAVVYLSLAPKSHAIYQAYQEARQLAAETSQFDPPKHILNAPTRLMKRMGYGKGYLYDHDTPQGCSGQNYFPEGVDAHHFYKPVERGFEREMKKRLEYYNRQRNFPQ